jgi:hypothetical protein
VKGVGGCLSQRTLTGFSSHVARLLLSFETSESTKQQSRHTSNKHDKKCSVEWLMQAQMCTVDDGEPQKAIY